MGAGGFVGDVRRHLSLLMTLAAWLLATGSHWELVQTFAWGRMILTYAQTVPLAEAVRLTFTPGNECSLCVAVQTAKQEAPDQESPQLTAAGKILLSSPPTSEFTLTAPAPERWAQVRGGWQAGRRECPPVPPPRGRVA